MVAITPLSEDAWLEKWGKKLEVDFSAYTART
jgi:hypothetical protein